MPTHSVVQRDGQKYNGQRDPPGQFTTYIPSGDPWKESYRAVTFRDFPQDTPVNPRSLANSGFFYTGYKDRVKCFSCGSTVENWILGDDPHEKKWHRDDCDFANGRDGTNEPILGIFKRYLAATPTAPRNSPTTSRQNESSNGRSTTINTGEQQNINSHYFHGATNYLPNRSNYSSRSPETQSPMDVDYPCLYPVNPHMRSTVARLETFKPTSRVRWPRERLRAGINEVANAGFFYLGERDRVKCWYCNGELQNWDYDDDPWTEHVKWFPSCEFLLRVKGSAFVQNIVDQYPNINRSTPTVRVVRRQSNSSSPPPSTNDIQQSRSTEEVVANAMTNQSFVAQAKDMGFVEDDIIAVLTSCGSTVENWILGDDPRDKKWHEDDCDFANGRDRTNEPILGIFKRYLAAAPIPPRNSPSTSRQNESSNGRSVTINGEHYVQQNINGHHSQGATNSLSNRSNSPSTPPETQSHMDVDYPCLNLVNPHMRSTVARLETFRPTPRVRCPRERLSTGVNEVANAGFFYLGERDRVKYWYCNGGLRNWDYDDEPCGEHATCFPSSELLLHVKGPAFVQNIVDQYANINRPTATVRVMRRQSNRPSPPPSTNDIQQSRSTEEVVANAMTNQSYVAQAKDMGFAENDIKAVLTRKHGLDGRLFDSVDEILDALMSYQQQRQPQPSLPQAQVTPSPQSTSPAQRSLDLAVEQAANNSMLSKLRSMEQSRLCKICYKERSNVVLVPCGHLACCSNCSSAELRRCPICHRGIQEKIRASRS